MLSSFAFDIRSEQTLTLALKNVETFRINEFAPICFRDQKKGYVQRLRADCTQRNERSLTWTPRSMRTESPKAERQGPGNFVATEPD